MFISTFSFYISYSVGTEMVKYLAMNKHSKYVYRLFTMEQGNFIITLLLLNHLFRTICKHLFNFASITYDKLVFCLINIF